MSASSSSPVDPLGPLFPHLIRLWATDTDDMFSSSSSTLGGTLHHRNKRILRENGLLNLAPSLSSPEMYSISDEHRMMIDQLPPTSLARKMLGLGGAAVYRLTRMTITEFILLYSELELALFRSYSSFNKTERDNGTGAPGPPISLHPADSFLLWVLHSDGINSLVLTLMMDVSRTTIDRSCDRVVNAIKAVWTGEIGLGSKEDRQALAGLFSCCENAVAVLDGTHMEVSIPGGDLEDEYYSGYKGKHTQNYLVLLDPLGFVLMVDGPFPGRLNDRGSWNRSRMKAAVESEFDNWELILGDGGFVGDGPFVIPFNAIQMSRANEEDRETMERFNSELQLNRSKVEHGIHSCFKGRTKALQHRFTQHRHKQAELVDAAARLSNRVRRYRLETVLAVDHV